jgi:hypothetical protein
MSPAKCSGRIISLLAACVLVVSSSNAKTRVRFRSVSGTLVTVPVYVNDHGPFDFLVDTGTNTTLIDADLAAELELKPVGRELLATLTGSEIVSRYSFDSITLGSESVRGLAVLAQEMKEVHAVDRRIRGVLGLDFLRGFAFFLDYGHQQIELYDPSEAPDLPAGTRVSIQLVRARILISTATEASMGGSWHLALDSGISKVAVFENRIKYSQDSSGDTPPTIRVFTNLSGLSTRIVTVRDLAIANLHLRDVAVLILPTNPGIQRGIEDGLLPMAIFRYILVNAKQGYVIFELERSSTLPQRPNP